MLRTFIQVQALLLVLISSYFLIKGMLSISAKDLAELSKTKWGYNKAVTKNFTTQRADTIVGFVLLLLSFLFQTINLLWPMRYVDFGVSTIGFIIAIITSAIILLTAIKSSSFLQRVFYKNVLKILNKDYPLGNVAEV
ncbi:MAG: hypothetical protein HQ580_01560 [Planctomycetes bacterium]|nr:hypothetical protein [Planctomycetota bacterium]